MAKPTVITGKDATDHRRDIASGAQPRRVELSISPTRRSSTLVFVIVVQMIALAYLVFCIASMVPQARAHFVDVFLHPDLSFFLNGR